MAIQGIEQPEILRIDATLRLRKYDGVHDFALVWYQDEDTNYLVDGKRGTYDMDQLARMYHYLKGRGEVYFIEKLVNDAFKPIGDVTFWQEDMPIVIGDPACRGKGIGRKVISALIERGRSLGYDYLAVGEIYDWNEGSRRCFESAGFLPFEKTAKGSSYRLSLTARQKDPGDAQDK